MDAVIVIGRAVLHGVASHLKLHTKLIVQPCCHSGSCLHCVINARASVYPAAACGPCVRRIHSADGLG